MIYELSVVGCLNAISYNSLCLSGNIHSFQDPYFLYSYVAINSFQLFVEKISHNFENVDVRNSFCNESPNYFLLLFIFMYISLM